MRYLLIVLCAHYGRSATPDKRDIDAATSAHSVEDEATIREKITSDAIASASSIESSHIPIRHTESEYHTKVAIPVPQAIPVSVPRLIPYPVHIRVPVDRPRPIPVPVPHPVAHIIPRPFAVPVDRPFPYPVPHPVPVTVIQGVGIPVPQPFHFHVPKAVPVKVPVEVGGYGNGYGPGLFGSGYAAIGVGSGFVGRGVHSQSVVASGTVVAAHGHAIEHPH